MHDINIMDPFQEYGNKGLVIVQKKKTWQKRERPNTGTLRIGSLFAFFKSTGLRLEP